MVESPHSYEEGSLTPSELPKAYTSPRTIIYHQLTLHTPPFTSIMQCYQAMRGMNLLISRLPILKSGILLTKPQLERIWTGADATARDTIVFMWAIGDLRLPTGIMEVIYGSSPFYIGRFVIRTLHFISRHHSTFHKHTQVLKLPTLKAYPSSIFYQIKEIVKSHPITFRQAMENLATEDTTICYEAVQQYTWLLEHHTTNIPNPYTSQQIKEYTLRILREKETAVAKKRFGTPHPRTILQTDY